MKSYTQAKHHFLQDPAVKKAYDKLGPDFELTTLLIEKRLQKGLTQSALAKKIGTKQSAIARLESGKYNPSLTFLRKVARALDAQLSVSMHS
ncbi:MAG: transcriptional regulator, XRE family [uncultured bacterium]|nr:MAG: transcriptional regulator, XRE family [uncultured bacterium]